MQWPHELKVYILTLRDLSVMLAELRASGEAANWWQNKDVIGYWQKSAEVIVSGKRDGIDSRSRTSTKLKD